MHAKAWVSRKRVGGELAKCRLQRSLAHLANQRFGLAAVLDQIGNGADLEAVFGRK